MKRFYILIIIMLAGLLGKGQDAQKNDFNSYYPVNQLRSDFVFFRAIIEKVHPSLYRYTSKDSMDHYFDQGFSKINRPLTEIEFWELLQPIVVKIGSGHTEVTLNKSSLTKYNFTTQYILPFTIYIRDNRVFVKNYIRRTDSLLKTGTEILAINNEQMPLILTQLRNLTPGDGHSNSYKDRKIEGSFNRVYNWLHGDQNQFEITFKTTGTDKTAAFKTARTIYLDPKKGPDTFSPELSYPGDIPLTAVLKIWNFKYEDYLSLHKKIFKELQKNNVKNLIIDLRDNGGGKEDIGINLMQYLIKKNFRFTTMAEGVVNANGLSAITKTNEADAAGVNISSIEHRFYHTKYDKDEFQGMPANVFEGNVFLLVNGGTFSAASLLAIALKQQRDCIIIGEETGGGLAGNDGGTIADIILPATHLNLRIPLLWTYSVSKEPDHGTGLKPDIYFKADAKDIYTPITKHIDPIMPVVKKAIMATENKNR